MNNKSRVLLSAGVGTLLSLSVITPAVAAGEISDIQNGVLLAKGAAARVTTTVACDAGSEYTLDLSLTQNVKKSNTGGSSQRSFGCTGETQAVTLDVRPSPLAFKNGTALAVATLFTCAEETCEYTSSTEEIRLR